MFLNYIKMALRTMWRQRGYAAINIVGLAVGITITLLILLYVRFETGYDQFNEHADNLVRVGIDAKLGGTTMAAAINCAPFGYTAVAEYPEVLAATRIQNAGFPVLRYGDKAFSEERWFRADSTFGDVFTLEYVLGDPKTALTQPFTVVITEEMARKYFGDENPMGKVLNSDKRSDWTVTGVVKSWPENAHFHFDFLAAMSTYGQSRNTIWVTNNFHTYLRLAPGVDLRELEERFQELVFKYVGPQVSQFLGVSFEALQKRGDNFRYWVEPVTDIHLHSDYDIQLETNGNATTVMIFSFIAIFILLLACINYMNLATARSMTRAREIGIRKTLGSGRVQLVSQFLAESIFVSLLAVALALVAVELLLDRFQAFIGVPVELTPSDIILTLLAAIPIGLIAGSYPAVFMSRMRPVQVLRGSKGNSGGQSWLRNGLVIFQFIVSIMLFTGTLVIRKQLNYLQTKDLGLNPDNVLVIEKTDDIGRFMPTFLEAVREIPGVVSAENTGAIPGRADGVGNSVFTVETENGPSDQMLMNVWVGYDYLETYGIEMAEGRFYSRGSFSDTLGVILNEAAVKAYGLEEPLGKEFLILGNRADQVETKKIIGVVKDYHYESPDREIRPKVLFLYGTRIFGGINNFGKFVGIRVEDGREAEVLAAVEGIWKKYADDQAFEYVYFDEDYALTLAAQRQAGQITLLFSILAIFIACLGLLGLASFTAQRRTKEIGIRKVLGATELDILGLLSVDMLKLVGVAAVIAVPLSVWAMREWLTGFAYRINLGAGVFILATLVAALVALATVAAQSWRVAVSDPVNSIRDE